MQAIKNKSKGIEVTILQTFLGIEADGIFGPKTTSALNAWKNEMGLEVNGIMSTNDWLILSKTLPTIKQNDKNKYVAMWQLILNITADGIFGAQTKASTKAYQSTNNLLADGIVAPSTWLKAFSTELDEKVPSTTKKNAQPKNFKQYDSKWGSTVYTRNNTYNKRQTIRNSGCGPTAMADIVATWWDVAATPKTLAALAVKQGYRTTNSGTAWGFFKYCANKYGASKFVQTSSTTTLKAALQNGAYAVVSFGHSKWTKLGHFCCIWKWDGKYFYINDPASASSTRAKGTEKEVQNAHKQYFIFYK